MKTVKELSEKPVLNDNEHITFVLIWALIVIFAGLIGIYEFVKFMDMLFDLVRHYAN